MLIVLEGIDNSGKTYQSEMLRQRLFEKGHRVRILKSILPKVTESFSRQERQGKLPPLLQGFLEAARTAFGMSEARGDEGELVIIDRFIHTIIAHGMAGDANVEWLSEMRRAELYDLGIYLDVTPEEAVARSRKAQDGMRYTTEYLGGVRKHYLDFVEEGELILVDGMRDRDVITRELMGIIEAGFPFGT